LQGKHLGLQKNVVSHLVKEFKIIPTDYKSPYNIDGDPHDVCPVHVKVLHRSITAFAVGPLEPVKAEE
jgi:diacylglycerol kinase family enzyme